MTATITGRGPSSAFSAARAARRHRQSSHGASLIVFTGLVMTMALMPLAGCRPKAKTAATEAVPVRVMPVELRTLKHSLDYAGNIRAREEAQVYPKVSGKILEKVREEGARVAKGDVLAYVDRDEVGFTYEKAPVESPLAGYVGRVYVDRGASVTLQTPVALVVDIEAVEVALDVPEKFIAKVKLEQDAELTVDAWPGEIFHGKVTKISPVIDLETRTAPVEIAIANPGYRLKPGMFARVRLVLDERKNVPVIIKEAVLGKDPDMYVYVANGGIARLRNVRLGLREGNDCEVTAGLSAGDRVVVMGQQRLREGLAVSAEEEPKRNSSFPNQKAKE